MPYQLASSGLEQTLGARLLVQPARLFEVTFEPSHGSRAVRVEADSRPRSEPETLAEAAATELLCIEELEAAKARLEAELLQAYARLHATEEALCGEPPRAAYRSAVPITAEQVVVQEVAAATGVGAFEVARRLELAVSTRRHQRLLDALGDGQVSLHRALQVTAGTRMLDDDSVDAVAEAVLVPAADGGVSSHRLFSRRLSRAVASAAPDAASRRRNSARARRSAHGRLTEDGMGSFTVTTTAERVVAVLDRADQAARGARAAGDARTLDQLRSDFVCDAVLYGWPVPAVDRTAEARSADEPGAAKHGGEPAPAEGTMSVGGDAPTEGSPNPTAEGTTAVGGWDVPTKESPSAMTENSRYAASEEGRSATSENSLEATSEPPDSKHLRIPRPRWRASGRVTELDKQRASAVAPSAPPPPTARDDAEVSGWIGRPPPAHVWIVVPFEVAVGRSDAPCELPGHGWVTAEHAREIMTAPGSVWQRLAVDVGTGRALQPATDAYAPTAAMVAHVRAVDGVCRGPACEVPAHRCDVDHEIPWPAGRTELGNLYAKHRFCHMAKTARIWQSRPVGGGGLEWTTLARRRYVTYPKNWREGVGLIPAQLGPGPALEREIAVTTDVPVKEDPRPAPHGAPGPGDGAPSAEAEDAPPF